jgi:hypothetical protein
LIEQTEMVVTAWHYKEPARSLEQSDVIESHTSIEVMKKRAKTKKGVAFRFTSLFIFEQETILEYMGEDSYVIDLDDIVNKEEVLRMIRNSFTKFTEKYEFRRTGTVLQNRSLRPLDESTIDLHAILPLLI